MATETRPSPTDDIQGWIVNSVRGWFVRNGPSLGIVALLLVLWQIYSQFINTRGDIYFPSIEYTIRQTVEFQETVIKGFQVTLAEVFVGFVLAVIIGVIVGVIFAKSFLIRQGTMPALVYFYSLPHAIVAPLFIVWFGNGLLGIGLFVAWFGFFSVLINTITGLTQVDEEFHYLAEVAGASEWQRLRKIEIWAALPHIVGGVKIAVQQSIVGAIIAEFIATGSGLGFLIILSGKMLRQGMMFGVLILIMLFAVIFYKFVSFALDAFTPGPAATART